MAPPPPSPERRLGGLDLIIRRNAEQFPNRIALDDRLHGRTFTYAELAGRSAQLARALQTAGVEKGDLVAYAFFNEHPSIEALFACCLLGAVAVPLNVRLAPAEAAAYMTKQGCKAFLSNADLALLAADADVPIRFLRGGGGDGAGAKGAIDYDAAMAAQSDAPMPAVTRWEDPYMMAMTGGTTGGPKAAVWGHGGLMMDMLSVMVNMEIRRRCHTIQLAPTFHAAGLGWAMLPVLWQGGTAVLPPTPSFAPGFVFDESRRHPPDYMLLVPAMIEPLYKVWDGVPVAGVASIVVASAPTPEAQRRKLQEMFPETRIVNGYGMTETFSMAVQDEGEWLGMPAAAGEPSQVTRIRIVDDDFRTLPQGEIGHVLGRSASMCFYYNHDPDNTKAAFFVPPDDPEGLEWMATGDMGFLDEQGRLTLVDRAKDVIITGGENVHSVEVETVLGDHPNVSEAAVIGIPDDSWGERVMGVVVKNGEIDDRTLAKALIAQCRARLSSYKVPKQIAFMDALPRNPFGKILKRDMVKLDYPGAIDVSSLGKESS